MTPSGVIPAFDPGKSGFGTDFEGSTINEFTLQAGKEAPVPIALVLFGDSPGDLLPVISYMVQ